MMKTFVFFILAFTATADVEYLEPYTIGGTQRVIEGDTAEWLISFSDNPKVTATIKILSKTECENSRNDEQQKYDCATTGIDFNGASEETYDLDVVCGGTSRMESKRATQRKRTPTEQQAFGRSTRGRSLDSLCEISYSVVTIDTEKVGVPKWVAVEFSYGDDIYPTFTSYIRIYDSKVSQLTIQDANATEGTDQFFVFKASLDRGTFDPITVEWWTSEFRDVAGAAIPNADYEDVKFENRKSFKIGGDESLQVEFKVPLYDDNLQEPMQTFEIKIDTGNTEMERDGLFLYTPRQILGIFLEEDEGVTISVEENTITAEEGTEEINVKITMSHNVAHDVVLPIRTIMHWDAPNPANRFPLQTFTPIENEVHTFKASNHFFNAPKTTTKKIELLNDDVQSPCTGQNERGHDLARFGFEASIPLDYGADSVFNIEAAGSLEVDIGIIDIEGLNISSPAQEIERNRSATSQWTFTVELSHAILGLRYNFGPAVVLYNLDEGHTTINMDPSPAGCATDMTSSFDLKESLFFNDLCWPNEPAPKAIDSNVKADNIIFLTNQSQELITLSNGPFTESQTAATDYFSFIMLGGVNLDGLLGSLGFDGADGYDRSLWSAGFEGKSSSIENDMLFFNASFLATDVPRISTSVRCFLEGDVEIECQEEQDEFLSMFEAEGSYFLIEYTLEDPTFHAISVEVIHHCFVCTSSSTEFRTIRFEPTLYGGSKQFLKIDIKSDNVQSASRSYRVSVGSVEYKYGKDDDDHNHGESVNVDIGDIFLRVDDNEDMTVSISFNYGIDISVAEGSDLIFVAEFSVEADVDQDWAYQLTDVDQDWFFPSSNIGLSTWLDSNSGTFNVKQGEKNATIHIQTKNNDVQNLLPCDAGSSPSDCPLGLFEVEFSIPESESSRSFENTNRIYINSMKQDPKNLTATGYISDNENAKYSYEPISTFAEGEGEQNYFVVTLSHGFGFNLDVVSVPEGTGDFEATRDRQLSKQEAISLGVYDYTFDAFNSIYSYIGEIASKQVGSTNNLPIEIQNDDVQEATEEFTLKGFKFYSNVADVDLRKMVQVVVDLECKNDPCDDPVIRIADTEDVTISVDEQDVNEPVTGDSDEVFTIEFSHKVDPRLQLELTYSTTQADSDAARAGSACGGTVNYQTVTDATASSPALTGAKTTDIGIKICHDDQIFPKSSFHIEISELASNYGDGITDYLQDKITLNNAGVGIIHINNVDIADVSITPHPNTNSVAVGPSNKGKGILGLTISLDKKLAAGVVATVVYSTKAISAPASGENGVPLNFGMFTMKSDTVSLKQNGDGMPTTTIEIETINDGCVYRTDIPYQMDIELSDPSNGLGVGSNGIQTVTFDRKDNSATLTTSNQSAQEASVMEFSLTFDGCLGADLEPGSFNLQTNGGSIPKIKAPTESPLTGLSWPCDDCGSSLLALQGTLEDVYSNFQKWEMGATSSYSYDVAEVYGVNAGPDVVFEETSVINENLYKITSVGGTGTVTTNHVVNLKVTRLEVTNEMPHTFGFAVQVDRVIDANWTWVVTLAENDQEIVDSLMLEDDWTRVIPYQQGTEANTPLPVQITVNTADGPIESDTSYSFSVQLSDGSGNVHWINYDKAMGEGVIENSDVTFVINVEMGVCSEETKMCEFIFTPTAACENAIEINYTPEVNKPSNEYLVAEPSFDYNDTSGVWTIPQDTVAHESVTFTIPIMDDNLNEASEIFEVKIAVASASRHQGTPGLSSDSLTGTIIDNDHARVEIVDAMCQEGETLQFSVSMTHASSGTVTADLIGLASSSLDCSMQTDPGKTCEAIALDFEFPGVSQRTGTFDAPSPKMIEIVTVRDNLVGPKVLDLNLKATNLKRETMNPSPSIVLFCQQSDCDVKGEVHNIDELVVTITAGDATIEAGPLVFGITTNNKAIVDIDLGYDVVYTSGTYQNIAPTQTGTATVAVGAMNGKIDIVVPHFDLVYVDQVVATATIANVNAAIEMTFGADNADAMIDQIKQTIVCTDVHGVEDNEEVFHFQVQVSKPINGDLSVHYMAKSKGGCLSSDDAAAMIPNMVPDFRSTSGNLIWNYETGSDSNDNKTVAVIVLNDDIQENEKHFDIEFTLSPEDSLPNPFTDRFDLIGCSGVLTDNEKMEITVTDQMVSEGVPGGVMYVPISLSHITETDIVLNFAFSQSDSYASAVQTLNVKGSREVGTRLQCPMGNKKESCSIRAEVVNDELVQNDRMFTVNYVDASPVLTIMKATGGTVTVKSDEDATIMVQDATGAETSGAFSFPVVLSHAFAEGLNSTLHYKTMDGTATVNMNYASKSNEDYQAAEGYITFDQSFSGDEIIINVLNDDLQEYDETFHLQLSLDNDLVRLEREMVTGHLVDDVECPTFVIEDSSALENSGSMIFDVIISHSFQHLVGSTRMVREGPSVVAYTTPGTAQPGVDYQDTQRKMRYQFNNLPATPKSRFRVELVADAVSENDEHFFAELDLDTVQPLALMCDVPTNGVSKGKATGTIKNDDAAVSISIQGGRSFEGVDKYVVFTLELSAPQMYDLKFFPKVLGCTDFYNCNGEATGRPEVRMTRGAEATFATAILDYGTPPASVTIPAGDRIVYVNIPLMDDEVVEPDVETFTLEINPDPENKIPIMPQSERGTIQDDDAGIISISNGKASEADSHLIFDVSLSTLVEGSPTFTTAIDGGTAVPGVDFKGSGNLQMTIPTYACNTLSLRTDVDCRLKVTVIGNDVVNPGAPKSLRQKFATILLPRASFGVAIIGRDQWPTKEGQAPSALSPANEKWEGIIELDGEDATISVRDQETYEDVGFFDFPIYVSHKSTVGTRVTLTMEGDTDAEAPSAGCFIGSDYVPPNQCTPEVDTQMSICTVDIPASCVSVDDCGDVQTPVMTSLRIKIVDDLISENEFETIQIQLQQVTKYPSSFSIAKEPQASAAFLRILDNDASEVEIKDSSGLESEGSLFFPVVLSHAVDRNVQVHYTFIGTEAVTIADGNTLGAYGGDQDGQLEIEGKTIYTDFQTIESLATLEVEAMSTNALIVATLFDDIEQECDEEFHASILGASVVAPKSSNYRVGQQKFPVHATGTILQEDEGLYVYFADDVTASEAQSPFTFTVMASHPASQPYAVSATGVAQEYSLDRFNPSSAARFGAHSIASQSVKVPVVNDYIAQPTGVFKMSFAATSVVAEDYPATCSYALNAAPLDKAMGTGYIQDNEDATVVIEDGQFAEGADINLPVTVSHEIGFVTASVQWSSDDGQSGQLAFPAQGGANMKRMIQASSSSSDCVDLPSSTKFTLDSLTSEPGQLESMSIADAEGSATLKNTDRATIKVMSGSRQSQDDSKYQIQLELEGCVDDDVVVDLKIEEPDQLPIGITDETGKTGGLKVTFSKGGDTVQTATVLSGSAFDTATFKIIFKVDAPDVELSQYIDFDFTEYSGEYISEKSDNGVISVSGGGKVDAGLDATFTVGLSHNNHKYAITYDYTTADGTATLVNEDFVGKDGTGTFEAKNNDDHEYRVTTNTRDVISVDKTFHFIVSNAKDSSGASVLYGTCDVSVNAGCAAEASITNKLRGKVSFKQETYTAQEGDELSFIIELDVKAEFSFSVSFNFTDDTAKQGTNYNDPSVNLNFAPKAMEMGYIVQTLNDNVVNVQALTFQVAITTLDRVQGLISIDELKSQATGTIESAETATVQFTEALFNSANGEVEFTVELLRALDANVAVEFSTSDDSALAGTDYEATTVSIEWAAMESGEKTVTVKSIMGPSWASPELHFGASLSKPSNPLLEITSSSAKGVLAAQGEVSFVAVSDGDVTEGDVFSMKLKMQTPVRKVDVSVELNSLAIINDADAGVPGMDYHPATSTVKWPISNGMILAEAMSDAFEVTTIVNTDLSSKAFLVVVQNVNSDSIPVEAASEALKVQVMILSSAKGIKTTAYNCKNPIKYHEKKDDGPIQTHGTVTLGYNLYPEEENDNFMSATVDIKSCFDTAGATVSYTAKQGNISVPVSADGMIVLNNSTLQFEPNTLFVVLEITASSGQTFSDPLTITVTADPYNSFVLSELVETGVRMGVFDYFSGWIQRVKNVYIQNVGSLTCKIYSNYLKTISGDIDCCEERSASDLNKVLMTSKCFIARAAYIERDPKYAAMQVSFQAMKPGRAEYCLGSEIKHAKEQCFSVTVPDTLKIPDIPDQYVVASMDWAVYVDFGFYGFRGAEDSVTVATILQNHALTIEPQDNGLVKISGSVSSPGKVIELSAVITTKATTGFKFADNLHQSTGVPFNIVTI